jgi:hypothetical protein
MDILSRVELELGDDAGEMRPHSRSRGCSMRSNQEAGARMHRDYVLYYHNVLSIPKSTQHACKYGYQA